MNTPFQYPRVVIEGDLVRHEVVSVNREVKLADLKRELCRDQEIDSGAMPTGCVYFTRRKTANGMVSKFSMMIPERIWPIKYKDCGSSEQRPIVNMNLSMPCCIYTVCFLARNSVGNAYLHGCRPFSTADKAGYEHANTLPPFIDPVKTQLFVLPLPNQHSENRTAGENLCLGSFSLNMDLPADQKVLLLLSHLVHSDWNKDLSYRYYDTVGGNAEGGLGITGLADWNAKSAVDIHFHRKMNFRPSRFKNLAELHAGDKRE